MHVGDVTDADVLDAAVPRSGWVPPWSTPPVSSTRSGRPSSPASTTAARCAVLDAASRARVGRFVHLSSNSPFGTNAFPGDAFRQHEPYRPYLGYGESKMHAEIEVRAAHERGDVPTVIIRPPWFYGPWQPARQTRFFSMVAAGRFPVPGDGSQRRSMAYVDNLVQGVALAERHPAAPGQAFWVADRDAYPLGEVVATVRRALDEEGLRTRDGVAPGSGGAGGRGGAGRQGAAAARPLRHPGSTCSESCRRPSVATSRGPSRSWATSRGSTSSRGCAGPSGGAVSQGVDIAPPAGPQAPA